MPIEVYLVKVGMNMTEGVVEEWYIPDGGQVNAGDLLYRLETEKVNLDVDAEATGTVKHLVAEGITMNPGDLVGHIYAAGEAMPAQKSTTAGASGNPSAAVSDPLSGSRINASPIARRLAGERGLDLATLAGTGPDGRIVEADILTAELPTTAATAQAGTTPRPAIDDGAQRSSPMARKRARELGLSLQGLTGSGPGGRIIREDVEALAAATAEPVSEPVEPGDRALPLKGMRKTIARRMQESLQSSAQLTMDMDVRMDDATKLRTQLIDEWTSIGLRPTYTDLVIRAAAKALRNHPYMNGQFTDTALILKGDIHIGMAVALSEGLGEGAEEGLIVPIVKHADRLSMQATAAESARLATAAQQGSLTPDDLHGGTFTVTTLGMFGVDSFTPILNAPQAGILGVNRIRDDTAWEGGTPVRVQMMRLSLTWDHRVLDGTPAARFLGEVRDLLESPYRLLI